MAQELQQDQELQRLIRLGEAARSCLGHEVAALKAKLDFPARIRNSLRHHPTGWLLGSLASGLAGSLLFRRRRVAPVRKAHKSLLLTLLGLALTAARPFAKVWLADQVKNYLTGRAAGFFAHRPSRRSQFQPPI